ncbi:UPF0389 protein CG9231 [Leptidea sinapis]|uniref:Uncharacterized protein n=1 Tax=Leptidea sinapis TaxID=189913 RepID=A0A5E4QWV9_9NEOP|nr:UPF0389 protein CG9231 [Leptidea sinapis]VVD01629.1 unnamed protein product [Leptidea sinapis]
MERLFRFRTSISVLRLRRCMCTPSQQSKPPVSSPSASLNTSYKPNDFQKFLLVWTKKYKNKDEIPNIVSIDLIDRARNEARIKLANILIFATILGCIYAVMSGKAAAKKGESVQQMNLDWHKQYAEQKNKEESLAK